MLVLFFASGISGLVYQLVWTRMLVLVFGNTLLATSTVLSVFMAGLAIGSYVFGQYIDREPRPLIEIYAHLEIGIGRVTHLPFRGSSRLLNPSTGGCTPWSRATWCS